MLDENLIENDLRRKKTQKSRLQFDDKRFFEVLVSFYSPHRVDKGKVFVLYREASLLNLLMLGLR